MNFKRVINLFLMAYLQIDLLIQMGASPTKLANAAAEQDIGKLLEIVTSNDPDYLTEEH